MNLKRILFSIATLAVVGGLAAGGTIAYYSDSETSENNIFTAGSVDLKVDHLKQTYNEADCETCSVTLESDTNTQVIDGDPEKEYPYPAIIVDEEDEAGDWAEISGVDWIWGEEGRPGPEDDTTYTFQEKFDWFGTIEEAFVEFDLAADDDFTIKLNGQEVESGTDAWQNTQTISIDPNHFNDGENVLTFEVTNSGAYYAGLLYQLTIERDSEECEEDDAFQQACQLWSEQDLDGSQSFFNFGDIKPGDFGTNVISLHVYDNDAYLCMFPHDEEKDSPNGGNIADDTEIFTWKDLDNDGNYDPAQEEEIQTTTLGDLESLVNYEPGNGNFLSGTSTEYIGLAWCAGSIEVAENGDISCDGSGVGNDAQASSFSASLTAYAEQKRNNGNFSCENVNLDSQN